MQGAKEGEGEGAGIVGWVVVTGVYMRVVEVDWVGFVNIEKIGLG